MIRTICGVAGTAALAVAGLAPVAGATGAHHDHHKQDEVKVLVCVKAEEDHHHGDYGHHDDDGDGGDYGHHDDVSDYVKVRAKTDEERRFATIDTGSCRKFDLDFDKAVVRVKAWPENSDDDVSFRTFGSDVENSRSHDNRIKVWFDGDAKYPFVGVRIELDHPYYHHDDSYDHHDHHEDGYYR